jgi:hypothetical protein
VPLEGALDNLDGSDDARAKSARLGKDDVHDGSLRCFRSVQVGVGVGAQVRATCLIQIAMRVAYGP